MQGTSHFFPMSQSVALTRNFNAHELLNNFPTAVSPLLPVSFHYIQGVKDSAPSSAGQVFERTTPLVFTGFIPSSLNHYCSLFPQPNGCSVVTFGQGIHPHPS
jgi:hypothetical protein